MNAKSGKSRQCDETKESREKDFCKRDPQQHYSQGCNGYSQGRRITEILFSDKDGAECMGSM